MKRIKTYSKFNESFKNRKIRNRSGKYVTARFSSFSQVEIDEIKSTIGDMLLELQFINIRAGVWVLSDKMVQVELRKTVKDKESAVLWSKGESFTFSDVKEVIDSVSRYLSEWGFVPYWSEEPEIEVRVNWQAGDDSNPGYDSCLYLRWKGGGV